MKKNQLILISIIVLGTILRLFYLGKIPNGLYSDEAAYGYNAYSILKTGRDEYGSFLPLTFKSFGDYKAPLYIYFMVPFIQIFGLNEIGVRASSVLLGLGIILLTYFCTDELFKNNKVALISAFMSSVTPFALQFNRMAHENNLSLFLILLGLLFFIKSLKTINYILLSFPTFGLSMYAYHDARLIAPILIVILTFLYRKIFWAHKKKILLAIAIFGLMIIPIINLIGWGNSLNRPKYITIMGDLGTELQVTKERNEDGNNKSLISKTYHNRLVTTSLNFVNNYFKQYSIEFLFINGDPVKIYNTVNNGLLLQFGIPFLFIGLFFIFRGKKENRKVLFVWLLLTPVPTALTKFVPSASRMFIAMPVLIIILSYGLYKSVNYPGRLGRYFKYIFPILLIMNMSYYLHNYYVNTPLRYAREWHYGVKQVMDYVKENNLKYDKVWLSKNVWGYIYPLFYLQYSPQNYQPQAKLSELNEFGFGWVRSFDKYILDDFPEDINKYNNILFIGIESDFRIKFSPQAIIKYPDNSPAFFIADQKSFEI